MKILDAPEIRRTERFGAPRTQDEPRCPVCGAACDWLYRYRDGDPVGCETCVRRFDAWGERRKNGSGTGDADADAL